MATKDRVMTEEEMEEFLWKLGFEKDEDDLWALKSQGVWMKTPSISDRRPERILKIILEKHENVVRGMVLLEIRDIMSNVDVERILYN